MSVSQRVAAIAVAILVLIGVAAVLLTIGDGRIGLGPEASEVPSPTASAPGSAPDGTPSAGETQVPETPATGDGDVLATIAEIEAQVIAIRGLEAASIGPPDIITRAELADELQELFAEQYPPDARDRDNRVLRAMGLLSADQDVADLQLQLLGDQVLGFYDTEERRMVVVTDAGLDAAAKLTYAHEYTHALQDAAFDPEHFTAEGLDDDDRQLAMTTLTEGDATVTMLAWAFEHLTQEELLAIGTGTELPDTTGIPSWMINQLQFPYTAGQVWIGALTRDPLAPDFTAVDAAYADPPDSTEQVIHLDKWESREPPIPVEVPDLVETLGSGWELVDESPIGEASIAIFLEHFGVARPVATTAAEGWGGDRVAIAYGPDDGFAVAWRLAWDSPEDADEFADAYSSVVAALPFPAAVRAVGESEVLVIHASSDDLFKQVAADAS
jgi:hypothetical protein